MKLAGLVVLGAALLNGQALSQKDLQSWLALWQKKQQLQDWTIQIGIARQKELGPDIVGKTTFVGGGMKLASIKILDAQELAEIPGRNARKYSELTLVHELVHVSLWPLNTGEDRPEVEESVEDIAEALLFGNVPACATPRDFMEAEIVSLPWKPVDARIREQIIRKMTAAFLDGRASWTREHTVACAVAIKTFFARSGWR